MTTKINNTYRGIHYEIETYGKHCNYVTYEYTPIAHCKANLGFGSCGEADYYTEEYVKGCIDEMLDSADLKTYGFEVGKHVVDVEARTESEAFCILGREFWDLIDSANEVKLLGEIKETNK